MSDNRLAEELLRIMPYPDQRYSPIVLICKNREESKKLLDKFKSSCSDKKIIMIDGCESIVNDSSVSFDYTQDVCIMFEDLQNIAGNSKYEQKFFDIFNSAFEKSIAILITLNNNTRYFPFEERNRCRFLWGIKEEIV